jgi:hypothetical protein
MSARPKEAASALADARRALVRGRLPFRLENDRGARFDWSQLGLTIAQRDRAVDELVSAGLARLVPGRHGITVEPVREGASDEP